MKIISAVIKNYRMLKDIRINIDKVSTIIVGKNNSGKTSFSHIFNQFIYKKDFSFEDFSLSTHDLFISLYKEYYDSKMLSGDERTHVVNKIQSEIPKIQLIITLNYSDEDDWNNIKPFIINLDETDTISIVFEYAPESTEKFLDAIHGNISKTTATKEDLVDEEILEQIKSNISFYKITIHPLSETEATENVSQKELDNLLRCHFIEAQRNVDDANVKNKSRLSRFFQKQYENKNDDAPASVELENAISQANSEIDVKLIDFFSEFVDSFQMFGFPGIKEQKIELKSELSADEFLKNNVKLYYNLNEKRLSENYNGLGFSNLLSIISEILGYQILHEKEKRDLTLIFIEEPEAHMHPQMQEVFIKKINEFLASKNFKVQLIMTTHSSHVISNSDFNCIRYFTESLGFTLVKDLMEFNNSLGDSDKIEFLKQYLTLGKCDLFFADKAILFEGVVERLLLPIFINKVDVESGNTNLTEQYISSIEIGGAYMHKFKELLEFLELKTLIITDIDSVEKVDKYYKKVEIKEADNLLTSNAALKSWIPGCEKIVELLSIDGNKKIVNNIRVAYQTKMETDFKCGRSFEEAFIIENSEYIFNKRNLLKSINNLLNDEVYNSSAVIQSKSYAIQDYIDRNKKKTDFAFDLMSVDYDTWQTPLYIKEGLTWLAK